MATTLTINSKTPTSISATVTREADTTTMFTIGTGVTWQDIIANPIINESIAYNEPTSVTINVSSGLSSNVQYGAVAYGLGGGESEISSVLDATLPAPQLLTQSVTAVTQSGAQVTITTAPDGGYYTKTIEYSLDNGSTWSAGANVVSGNSTTTSFNITGLSANTPYTLKLRVTTTAGSTACPDSNFVTLETDSKKKLLGSVNGSAESVGTLLGSSSGNATRISKVYGSINGVAKRFY